jgi:hypothetical protein
MAWRQPLATLDCTGTDWRFVVASVIVGGGALALAWHSLVRGDIVTTLGAALLLPSAALLVLLGISDPTPNLRTDNDGSS